MLSGAKKLSSGCGMLVSPLMLAYRRIRYLVMAGHSRLKDGVASLAYARPSTSFLLLDLKDVDARDKPGHDDVKRRQSSRHQTKPHPAQIKPVPGHLAALRPGRLPHLGDIGHLERQPAHQIGRPLDEVEAGIGQ